jgi:DNA polymerase I-like protein with 3'-5' exonuclease and polymerase domains
MIQTPMFETPSNWTLPKELPNLQGAAMIGLDTETKDLELKTKGPGVRRGGYMVGISVAVPEGQSWYIPFGHNQGEQFEKENVLKWAKDNLTRPGQPKVGANLIYDLDYLYHAGVEVAGPFYDTQIAEPLIDENRKQYGLDSLAKKYLGEVKRETILAEACQNFGLKGAPQNHIWWLDPKYVGHYAEGDAIQALRIFEKQKIEIERQELDRVFDIETRLVPMLLHMRRVGVPIDLDRVTALHEKMSDRLDQLKSELTQLAGHPVDIWAAESIARAFDAAGLDYPRTPKTNAPSFVKGWLEKQTNEVARKIAECRTTDKFIGTFLEGSLLEMLVGNRIHCQFNQLRNDDFGARTGRLSSSLPNLQFIPTRTNDGKMIRMAFIPDPGFRWVKADYSQIEIRILAHYAMGIGADAIRKAFNDDPRIDYHQWCANEAHIDRSSAKTINFGLIYGMGIAKLAKSLGISIDEATAFRKMYFRTLPFVKKTVDAAASVANRRGYVKTILGRRRRFDLYEPADYDLARDKVKAHPDPKKILNQVEKWANTINPRTGRPYKTGVQRAGTYKAFNAADQGSAADIMKMALVAVYESGVCDIIKPYITVHDELDFGAPISKAGDEATAEVKRIMENVYELKVPTVVDVETGDNWGSVKNWEYKKAT